MRTKRVFYGAILFVVGFAMLVPSASFAGGYPDRNIQLIITYVPGATGDIKARMLADEMQRTLRVKIIPNNRPGASGVLGTDLAVRAKKDGYTLVYTAAASIIYAPIITPDIVRYDPFKDLEPLGLHCFFPMTVAVRSDAPWKTFPELIDHAKKNPGKLRYSTVGVSSTPHIMMEMIQGITGAKFTHVPFEGGESVMTAVLGNHVELTCDGYAKVKPHADAGKMRVLLTSKKLPFAPAIPTIADFGYKDTLFGTWFGVYAPTGIPEEAKKTLVLAIEKAVQATKAKIDQMGSIGEYRTPEEQRKMAEEEYKSVYGVAIKMGLRKTK